MSLSWKDEEIDNHGLEPLNKFKYSQTYGKDIKLEPNTDDSFARKINDASNWQPPQPKPYNPVLEAEERRAAQEKNEKLKRQKTWANIVLVLCVVGWISFLVCNSVYTNRKEDEMETLIIPASGTILAGNEYYDGSEITVTADSSNNYVVSLQTKGGTERVAFFVRAGETVTVGVPSQLLYVYFASGDNWYGYEKDKMFGTHTVYSMDDELKDFIQYTWEYTLHPVTDGNFSETPINADEFF